jgi:cold shock CspA family protein
MDGYIARLTDRGFGFIREGTPAHPGHQEWFFHRAECVPPGMFITLHVGALVSFTPGRVDERGPRAEAVHLP